MVAGLPGQSLGPAVTVSESNVNFPSPLQRPQLAMFALAAPAPSAGNPEAFAAGLITVTANVNIVFDILNMTVNEPRFRRSVRM